MRIVTIAEFTKIALDAAEELIERGVEELTQQGHIDTGKSSRSLEAVIVAQTNDSIRIAIQGEDYLLDLDQGVPPDKVDFSQQAENRMLDWASRKQPTLSASSRKRFVFQTMNKAGFIGYPLPGAYLYTNNGRRTGWIKEGIEKNVEEVFEIQYRIFELISEGFEALMNDLIADTKKV